MKTIITIFCLLVSNISFAEKFANSFTEGTFIYKVTLDTNKYGERLLIKWDGKKELPLSFNSTVKKANEFIDMNIPKGAKATLVGMELRQIKKGYWLKIFVYEIYSHPLNVQNHLHIGIGDGNLVLTKVQRENIPPHLLSKEKPNKLKEKN